LDEMLGYKNIILKNQLQDCPLEEYPFDRWDIWPFDGFYSLE